jgi:endonuclease YncB( thermonuclease family)
MLLLAAGVLVLVAAAVRSETAERQTACRVLKVYDGDTILVAAPGQRQMVRLLGIDAPETSKGKGQPGQPYSQKARRHLADLILAQTVTLVVYGEDRYQRMLAVVYRGDQDINHPMIQAGLAEVYRGRTPRDFDKAPYLESEAHARQAGIGMWRQGSAYMSPIRWKHPR